MHAGQGDEEVDEGEEPEGDEEGEEEEDEDEEDDDIEGEVRRLPSLFLLMTSRLAVARSMCCTARSYICKPQF